MRGPVRIPRWLLRAAAIAVAALVRGAAVVAITVAAAGVVAVVGVGTVGCAPGAEAVRATLDGASAGAWGAASRVARFPLPPMQRAPWSSAARLPAALLAAARALFVQGFADPRGCAYREIELAVGNIQTGDAGTVRTRGFVLPGERFAIAWNGLVYPVVEVGAPVELADDVAAAAASASHPMYPMLVEERASVLPDENLQMVVLLARLGEDALAEQVWSTLHYPQDPSFDPYGEIALRWVWRLYDRALTAHRRGDHGLALESLRLLTSVQPLVDTAVALRGLRGPDGGATYLDFLGPVPALLADEERRAARGPIAPLPDAVARARLPVAARVAVLIEHLDEVAAYTTSADGGASDPIVDALVQIGAPAVEPLIEVLASDRRLARAVTFHSEAFFGRRAFGVDEAAYLALSRILRTRLVDPQVVADVLASDGMAARRELAERFRAYVRHRSALAVEQRWFEDLADLQARPELWLDAAEQITSDRSNGGRLGKTWLVTGRLRPAAIGLRGESLRARTAPSVSDLFAVRISLADVPTACALALRLFEWDRAAGARWLDWVLTRAIGESGTTHQFATEIARVTERRLAAGDVAVLDTYAAWLEASALEAPKIYAEVQVRFPLDAQVFHPMSIAPWRPSIVHAAEALFRDGSSWVPLLDRDRLHGDDPIALLDGELLAVAAFNRHVVKALADAQPIGRLTIGSSRHLRLQMSDSWGLTEMVNRDAMPLPPDGTEIVVRIADWYAARLAHSHARDGAPAFELFWSEAERNAALRAMASWVRTRVAPRP